MRLPTSGTRLIWLAMGMAIGFWLVDSFIDWYFFDAETLNKAFFPFAEPKEIWMRSIVMLLLIGIGIYAQASLNRQHSLETSLRLQIEEHKVAQEKLATSEAAIRKLYEIASVSGASLQERVQKILILGCEHCDMPIGILAHIEGDKYHIVDVCPSDGNIPPGAIFSLGDTYCRDTMHANAPVAFENAGNSQWQSHPAYRKFQLEAYMGAPVMVGKTVYGTLNFSSFTPRLKKLSHVDLEFLQLMSVWVGEELERELAYKKLRQAASVFEGSSEGIIITDANNRIQRVNGAFTKITGYTLDEVVQLSPRLLCRDQHADDFYCDMDTELETTGFWQGEATHKNKNGSLYPVWESISAIKDDQGNITNYVTMFSNISLVKQAEAHLSHLAYHDPLTQLPNRLMLFGQLDIALSKAKRNNTKLIVFFIDLDGFKSINDTLGHGIGDRVLQKIAQRFKSCVRESDLVARYGGDEFVIVFSETMQRHDIVQYATRVINIVSMPIKIDNKQVQISTSLGISIYPDDARDATELIRAADQSMYRSKEHGRNMYHFASRVAVGAVPFNSKSHQ